MANKKDLELLKREIQGQLVQKFVPSYFFADQKLAEKKKSLEEEIKGILFFLERTKNPVLLTPEEKKKVIKEIINEMLGYGPIDDLMRDDSVTEILINGPYKVYVERAGNKVLSDVSFSDINQLYQLIQKLVSYAGRKVDETTPYVDAALEDGSRVNVIIPPVALKWPIITIRKFSKDIAKIEDLVRLGTLSEDAGQFLVAAVMAQVNIIFSGATGVGKTTTLGVLSTCISPHERIVVIEDTAELEFYQEHVVRLQARLPNLEGKGEVSIRDLLKNSLRMRPERIIIGEVRGGEALDMLQAMASGHSGALGVIHAASPRDVISRLETMIATSGVNIPLWTIKRHIANNLNVIIQQDRLQDGSRKIMHITEIRGMKNDEIILEDIFTFIQEGIDSNGNVQGKLRATGVIPLFLPQLESKGIKLDPKVFKRETKYVKL